MSGPLEFSAVLLVGGRSTRMGRDKALLPHPVSTRPLILHQLETLEAAGAAEVFLSIRQGADYEQVPASVPRVCDDGARGPLAAITLALAAARHPLLLVLAVDLPAIVPATLRRLVDLARLRATPTACPGVVPIGPTGPEPLCALYPRAAYPVCAAALVANRLSLRHLIRNELMPLDWLIPAPIALEDLPAFTNWNHPDDLPDRVAPPVPGVGAVSR